MRISGIAALRPPPAEAARVTAPPYDTISTAEARGFARENDESFLHVSRSEIDLPEDTDPYSDKVYERAKKYFLKLQKEEHLLFDDEPAVYIYEQIWKKRAQRGFVVLCHTEDYERNVIKKHEKTREAKETDRLRHNLTIGAQPGLVFLAFRDDTATDELLSDLAQGKPHYDFVDENKVRHCAWRAVGDSVADVVAAFAKIPAAYIADGHHRAASAWRASKAFREQNKAHKGDENYNWFPACLFPASNLRILPYNRVVKDLNGLKPTEFIEKLRKVCKINFQGEDTPAKAGNVSMYLNKRWHGLTLAAPKKGNPIAKLDASILQDRVLAPLLDIADPRTSDRVDFIGGIRGPGELKKLVDAGKFAVAFSMYPVSLDQLMEIADADEIMPPKSTWFEPKLRSGLFIHPYR